MFDDEITVRQVEDGKLAERLHVAVESTDTDSDPPLANLRIGTTATEFSATHLPSRALRDIGRMLIDVAERMDRAMR